MYGSDIEDKEKVIDNMAYSGISLEDEVIDRCMISKYKKLLEPEELKVIMLNIIQDVPQKEIAKMLNTTQSCISKMKKRALKKLKKFIEEAW